MNPTSGASAALTRVECLQHLALASVGRVGVSSRALPAVIPVRFALLGDRIVFWADPRGHPESIDDNTVVAFQADDIDSVTHDGWTVGVVGIASHVREPAALASLEGATPRGWSDTIGPLISLSLDMITGRRLSNRSLELKS